MNKLEELEKLQKLKECGAITIDEFEQEKKKILNFNENIVDTTNQIKEDVLDHKEAVTNQVKKYDDIKDTLDNKVDTNKKGTIKIKFNHLIIGIIVAIIVISLIIVLIFKLQQDNQDISNNNENVIEDIDNNEGVIEKIYITQDSDASPTGKEFIGLFSERFKEVYEASMNICDFVTYNTSIENVKQYTQEHRLKNNITGNMDIVEERAYYYNSLNNKFIGSYIKINNIKEQSQATINNGYTLEEYLDMVINLSSVIFQNAYNGSGDEDAILRSEEYFNYANSIEEIKSNTFEYKNCTYTYIIKGCDMLTSVKTFKNDSNKMEVLLLAYDENSDPEEVIKNWYDKVTTLNEEQEDVEQQEELYDDESSTNKQENSNNSNSDDKKTSNSNNQSTNNNSNSNSNNAEKYEDTTITFSYDELRNKTENELVKIFKEKGLVPKVNKRTTEVPYVDEKADTTVITNSGYGSYEKGETVEIGAIYYKPVAWKTYVSADTSKGGKTFNVKGKECYTYKISSTDVAYCCYENPVGLSVYEMNKIKLGVEFYINGELAGKGTSLSKEYTFDKVETITFKVVAPYVYEFSKEDLDEGEGGTIIDTNVVLYEKKINVKNLYIGERELAKIEIN